jgi:hypothetical protein
MTLQHDDATANISIDGLAICCFNHSTKLWEIGFLRHPAHHLTITAKRGADERNYQIDQAALKIEFKTVKGLKPDFGKYKDGFFDVEKLDRPKRKKKPADDDHKENFRWTLDVDNKDDVDHGKITLRRPQYGATIAYLDDALFYTISQTPISVYLVPEGDDPRCKTQNELEPFELGMTNDVLGADIKCQTDGEIKIIVDGVVISHLDHKAGEPWRVCLMNMRDHHEMDRDTPRFTRTTCDLEPGDFQLYYAAFKTTKSHFVIWGYPIEPAPADPCGAKRSGRTDCNTVRVGSTIDNLDNLLST